MLNKLLGGRKSGRKRSGKVAGDGTAVQPLGYDEEKRLASDGDIEVRRAIARREDVQPEILYYLAEDEAWEVRREIAGNTATPSQANVLLAYDENADVRCDLARKISRLLPDLSPTEQVRVRETAIEVLEVLADDQLPRVRQIIAEELKHTLLAPHGLVKRLAKDMEAIVHAPVLEYSPLLNDDDLLEIIKSGSPSTALAAMSRRGTVSEPLSQAIVETMDVDAISSLLANGSAQIREETLDQVISQAETTATLHKPLVMRRDLSLRAVRRIAGFVASSLVDILVQSNKLPPTLASELTNSVRQRIATGKGEAASAAERVEAAIASGELDDEYVADAIERGDTEFVTQAFAQRAGLPGDAVAEILEGDKPRLIVALVWKAGFSMRVAVRVETRIARIKPEAMLYARDGVDFPMTAAEMSAQFDYLTA